MTGDIHMLLGGYVLGGLSAQERQLFAAHLPDCQRCREELADAAPLPGLLRRVPGVPGMSTPPAADETPSLVALLSTVRTRRRRQQAVRLAAAAAAAVVAVGSGAAVATATQHSGTGSGGGRTIAVTAGAGLAASGHVAIAKKKWGTAIAVDLVNLPRTGTFVLRATDDRGHTESAATWAATAGGDASLSGTTSINVRHLTRVTVTRPDNTTVATAPVPPLA